MERKNIQLFFVIVFCLSFFSILMKPCSAHSNDIITVPISEKSVNLDGELFLNSGDEWDDANMITFTSANKIGLNNFYIKYDITNQYLLGAFLASDKTYVENDGIFILFDVDHDGGNPEPTDLCIGMFRETLYYKNKSYLSYYAQGNGTWNTDEAVFDPTNLPSPFGDFDWAECSFADYWCVEFRIFLGKQDAVTMGIALDQIDYEQSGGTKNRGLFPSESDPYSPSSYADLIFHINELSFKQFGLDGSASDIILTVGDKEKNVQDLPFTNWYDYGTPYNFTSQISSTTEGKRFILTNVTGLSSPITTSGIVTGNYKTQFRLTFDSSYNFDEEGWYDAGSTVTLRSPPPQGFLVREFFYAWTGDIQSASEEVSIVMDGPKHVIVVWATDDSPLYMTLLFLFTFTGIFFGSHLRIKKKRLLNENILKQLNEAIEAIYISELAKKNKVSEDKVRQLINEFTEKGILKGSFTRDGKSFVTEKVLKQIIKEKFI